MDFKMNMVKLININNFCKEEGISRSTFYRKVKKEEIEVYKVPCSKRLWLVLPEDKQESIDQSNVLDYLQKEEERMIELASKIL